MPDSDWPPRPRLVARTARTVAYLALLLGAAFIGFSHPLRLVLSLHPLAAAILPWIVLGFSAAALVGVLIHRWHIEWVALAPLGFALGAYWLLMAPFTITHPTALNVALLSLLTNCIGMTVNRWIDLHIFSQRASGAKRRTGR